jgi:hypothetical protein
VSRPGPNVRFAVWLLERQRLPSLVSRWALKRLIAHNRSLIGATATELRLILAGRQSAQRAMLLSYSLPGLTPRAVLDGVAREALVAPAAVLLSALQTEPGALSLALSQAITLDLAGSEIQTRTAFLAVRRAPERVLAPHRLGIFRRAWSFSEQPVDPYQPSALHSAARSAAAALISEHGDVRAEALSSLPGAVQRRQLMLVYAAGLQGIREQLADEFVRVLAATDTSEQDVLGFARDCDRDFSAQDPVPTQGAPWWRTALEHLRRVLNTPRPPRQASIAASILGWPVCGASLALAFDQIVAIHYNAKLSTGTIVAIAGVLVAIHVVASELAADRLPGLVARATSIPLPLWGGYGSVAVLYGLALWAPVHSRQHLHSLLAIGVALALALSLVAALSRLLSRTDNVVAAQIFASGEARRATRAGRKVGRLHRSILTSRSKMNAMSWIRPTSSLPLSVHGYPVSSGSEGYLVISERVLSRLDRDERWQDGSRLWVSEVAGSLVHRGDALATLTLPDNAMLEYSTRSEVQRLFRTRRLAGAERAAEAVTALVQLTNSLAESGNEAGASRAAVRTVELLEGHLRGLEHGRGELPEGETGAPVVVSRTASLAIGRAMRRAEHPAVREVMSALIRRSLSVCTSGDPFLGTMVGELDPRRSQAQLLVLDLLEECGRAAVRLGDRVVRDRWWEMITELARDEALQRNARAAAGRMVQYSVLVASRTAEANWTRLAALLRDTDSNDIMTAARFGATALAIGQPSLSVLTARWLPHDTWGRLDQRYKSHEHMEWEKAHDQLYGHLLGAQPEAALEGFVRLGRAVTKDATATAATGPQTRF